MLIRLGCVRGAAEKPTVRIGRYRRYPIRAAKASQSTRRRPLSAIGPVTSTSRGLLATAGAAALALVSFRLSGWAARHAWRSVLGRGRACVAHRDCRCVFLPPGRRV